MKRTIAIWLFVILLVPLSSANAVKINYEATELGASLWQYDYYVSGFDFDTDYGFQIFYEYGLYENITPISNSVDWDAVAWDPELFLGNPDDGVYDALALVDDASLSEAFSVQFTWLGLGNPNGQYFEVYDPCFEFVDSGQSAPVPEPSTLFMVGFGLVGIAAGLRRKYKNI